MGTNYYARYKQCNHCDRYDEIHLGKSSGGWSFSFHGLRPDKWDVADGAEEILSETAWKTWLWDNDHQIHNEYGDKLSDQEFWEMVEAKRDETHNHTIYCQVGHPSHAYRDCWLDPDTGSSFAEGEFS